MPTLMDRLKSLGVTLGPENLDLPSRKRGFDSDLAAYLDGTYDETIFGPVIRIVKHYPLGFKHGNIYCQAPETQEVFRSWGNLPPICAPGSFLFLDTETSGLSSGTGTFAFLVGIGFFLEDSFQLIQYFLESPAQETAMLASFLKDISGTETLVTYNGKSFDIPLLRNRMILNRMQHPLDSYHHADLLHITRKLYKLFLPERNLGSVEKEILQFQRDELEVPGWMVPEIYAEFLQNHNPEPIKRVLYHNQIDILSLAALYQHINEILFHSIQNRLQLPHPVLLSIIRLFIETGDLESAKLILQHLPMDEAYSGEYAKTCYLLGFGYKQKVQLIEAVPWWETGGQYGHLDSWIELAKYYEHHIGNYTLALSCTKNALKMAMDSTKKDELLESELRHREKRICRYLHTDKG